MHQPASLNSHNTPQFIPQAVYTPNLRPQRNTDVNSQPFCSPAQQQSICWSWPTGCEGWGHTCSGTVWGQGEEDEGLTLLLLSLLLLRTQMLPPEKHKTLQNQNVLPLYIRALVDALCRDGAGHVSRNPCTNSPLSHARSISWPQKNHQNHPEAYPQLYQCLVDAYVPSSFHTSRISHAGFSRTTRHHILLLLLLLK